MWYVLFPLLTNCFCTSALMASHLQQSPEPSTDIEKSLAELTVVVTDSFGTTLPEASITIRDSRDRKSPVRIIGNDRRVLLPGGRYEVSAELSGFITASKVIDVYTPKTSLSIGLALGRISGTSRVSVVGSLSRLDSYRSVAVMLIGIYTDEHLVATVLNDGTFKVDHLLPGEYFAIVVRYGAMPNKGAILALSRISRNLDDESEIRISIGTFSVEPDKAIEGNR